MRVKPKGKKARTEVHPACPTCWKTIWKSQVPTKHAQDKCPHCEHPLWSYHGGDPTSQGFGVWDRQTRSGAAITPLGLRIFC